MKIRDVRAYVVPHDGTMSMPGYGRQISREIVLVEMHDTDGMVGCSATWAPLGRSQILVEAIAAIADPMLAAGGDLIEACWRAGWKATRQTIPVNAAGALDVALWDLHAKRLGVPLHRLLGGFRDRILAYASTQKLADLDAYMAECERFLSVGFKAIKLHPFGRAADDIELYRRLRSLAGPDILLMTDCVGTYDRREALMAGRVLDELQFYWYEEPLDDQDPEGYRMLRERLDTPVAGVDSIRLGIGDYTQWLRRDALDIVRSDASRQGISFGRKLATVAEAFGCRFEPHGYGSALAQAANLHLSAASPSTTLMELPAPIGEFDVEVHEGLVLSSDGTVAVPSGPGLGLEVDWDRVTRAATTTRVIPVGQ